MIHWLIENLHNSPYLPHALCLLESEFLIFFYILFNTLIAAAYFWLAYKCWGGKLPLMPRPFGYIFGVFILSCGLGHLFRVYTLFSGQYVYEVAIDGITAAVSLASAILVVPVVRIVRAAVAARDKS